MGTWIETKEHARRTLLSLSNSRQQTATAVAALSLPALLSPVVAVACAAAAGALLVSRHRAMQQPFATGIRKGAARHEGIYPIGTMEDGTPVRLTAQQIRSGVVVRGDTGSGRTEVLLGIAESMLAKGSGMIWVDGVGDVALYARVVALAAALGREDDVLVVFPAYEDGTPRGHCFNPFENGTMRQLRTLIVDLLEEPSDDPSWRDRFLSMTTPILEALVWRRDNQATSLDVDMIIAALNFESVVAIAEDQSLPEGVKFNADMYLRSLPGYQPERGAKQARSVIEQHGFLEVQVSTALRHIVRLGLITSSGCYVDLADVLLNDRILVVVVPSLDRDRRESSIFGRAVIATLKMAVASMSKPAHVGEIGIKPARTDRPFPIVLNEVGYYASSAIETVAIQSDSLGLSIIYGVPDRHIERRYGSEVVGRLIAGANVTMRLSQNECGRMTASVGGGRQELRAIFPRPLDVPNYSQGSSDRNWLNPVELVPLAARAAN